MRFALLGQLTAVNDDGGQVLLAGARLRVLLAALLLDANTPISTEALAEAVWDGAPPPAALETLRSYIRRLRRALGPVAEARIAARYPGYLIQVAPEELDVLEFEVLYRRASSAARESRWTEASDAATLALDLWRGDPLLDVRSQVLYDAFVPRLQQFRMRVLEDRIEAELGLGHHKRLIPELKALTGQNPLHERFHARLMLALFRAGRPAEALDAYQRARRTLIDELGVEPGAELRRVHERILAGDPDLLEAPRPTSGSPIGPSAVPRAVPRQLPAGVRHFVGRAIEIKTLSNLVGQASADAGAMVVSAISGGAGIGKTALAIHWAHLNADRFPDGQLYVNLRGFDPSGTPSTPAEALRGFLRALDIPAQSIPADPADQATLYRSRLADQRMLIVLDNACEVDQIRPLLPGSPGCMVLVTSRNQLGGLVALDGAVPMTLDLLSSHEALDLLITRLGRERVLAEEQTASELVALCARLPLALNLAAARAALHPRLRLSELVDGLRDARRLLDTLALGDDAADPRAVFSWSYRALDPLSARVFRLLSMHPGPHITLPAVASLAALDPDVVREILGTLTAAYLITEQERGRYGFHDLLRAYAAEQADAQDSEVERREALRRVCDYYAHSGYAEELVLNPNRSAARFDPPVPGVRSHATSDQAAAVAWFEAEHANILAAQQVAITRGWHATVWQLAWVLTSYHFLRGLRHEELAVWQAAAETAVHLPDPSIRPRAHRYLGRAHVALERHEEAMKHLHEALAVTDLTDQAHTHHEIAWAWEKQGNDQQALFHATCALDLYRVLGNAEWESQGLNQVGWYAARLGDYETARTHCQAALTLNKHHPASAAATLDSLGYIEYHTGHHHEAVEYYEQAAAACRSLGYTYQSALTLDRLGHPYAALGQNEHARAVWQQAIELYRQQGRFEDAERTQQQLDALDRSA